MVDEIDKGLLEVFELHQNLDEPVSCDVSRWLEGEYQPKGFLGKIAQASGFSEVGLSRFADSFKRLESTTSLGLKKIHRSEVLALGAMYRQREVSATELFLASMMWGNGSTGYGTYRTCIALNVPRKKGIEPISVIEKVGLLAASGDIKDAYETMTNALWKIGPAFGTKFLYFASPLKNQALIFDGVVAQWSSPDSTWKPQPSSAWSWNWKSYNEYMEWCEKKFNALPAEFKNGLSTLHGDGVMRVDMVEASIFTHLNSRKLALVKGST